MIVRDNKNKPQTPLERLKIEEDLFTAAQAEEKISSEYFAEQVAELLCENALCIAENKGSKVTVKLFNGQIFKLSVKN